MLRKLAAALRPTFRYWMQTEVHVYAFSVAANVLLSFFPFLIVVMSICRRVFPEATVRSIIHIALSDIFPDAFSTFLNGNLPRRSHADLVSVVLLLFTANGIFEPLEVALNRVWGIRRNRNFLRNQAVSFALIFVCGALALISLMLAALNHETYVNLYGPHAAWVSIVVLKLAGIPLVALILFLIYRFLPNGRPPLDRVIVAAISVGLLMEVLTLINRLIWPWFYLKLGSEYDVFKNSVTLILIGFLSSMLVLAGAEWSARGHRIDDEEEEYA